MPNYISKREESIEETMLAFTITIKYTRPTVVPIKCICFVNSQVKCVEVKKNWTCVFISVSYATYH